ncbi:hypothetical protein KR059_010376, partial [Drosophila kikkawai]
ACRWYLEHVTTRDRIDLNQGENLMGRHSCCRISLGQSYDFVSREHVNIIVSESGVIVQEMNSRNGVFINEERMSGEFKRMPVVEGTIISLGVEGHFTDIPRSYPIFLLRKVATEAEEVVLLSDDDGDTLSNDGNLAQIKPDLGKKMSSTDQEGSCTNLHLPKIPDVKQELVSKTTEEITNIFGEADEAILGGVMDINPYLYNQLNKKSGGTTSTSAKIYDGDVIELDTEPDKTVMQPPPPPEAPPEVMEVVNVEDDEYDEQFAMSQAVLQEMKTEMASSDDEEDVLAFKNMEDEQGLDSPSSQISYDEIIIEEKKAKEPINNRNSSTPKREVTVEDVTPVNKGPSPRLLNRSKSCFIDQPDNITKTTKDARGPAIIEAPFMSKNRCKVDNKEKQRVIDRQRFVDYQAEMTAKWHQKPKDKKKDDQVIKEKRREALKKLSDKRKDEENSPSTSNASKRKNCTSVPTISNTNRGEFLTKEIDRGPPAKIAKKVEKLQVPPVKHSIPKRRSTINTPLQQLLAAEDLAKSPEPQGSRRPERKEAQQARNQRTCNRVNFADMERESRRKKQQRRVRFCDKINIIYIESVSGACKPVRKSKDSSKICLSTYSERREWTLKGNYMVNDILHHKRTILTWANQWLKHGSVDAVGETDVLMPIPSDFSGFRHYIKTFLPLMRLELLTTIERDYKNSKPTLDLKVIEIYCEKECYHLVARSNAWDMTFQICVQVPIERLKTLKQVSARPVVDSLRVELGALSAIHQLYRSPLCRRILMPTEAVKTLQIPTLAEALAYKGFSKLNKDQEDICLSVYERVIDAMNPSLTLVQGPPGTGKSILLSNLSLQCLYGRASVMLDRKILICAHSNTAVDHMVRALSKAHSAMSRNHFHLLRFGLNEKISQHSRKYSLEAHFKKAREDKLKRLTPENIEILKKQHSDLSAEIQQLKQNSNLKSTYLQQQLEQKQKQLLLISQQLNPPLTPREEYDISKTCLKRAHIVCTTLSSCVKLANYVDFFDICIIDEATQCTEPWTLLPMRFGIKHLVLVGDTQQLPAVVLSKKAIDFGLGNSMFDRIQKSLVKQLKMDLPGGN